MKKAITTLAALLLFSSAAFGAAKSSKDCPFAKEIEKHSLTTAPSSTSYNYGAPASGSKVVDNIRVSGGITVNAHELTPESIFKSYGL